MGAWKRLNGGGLNFMISALIAIALIGALVVVAIPIAVMLGLWQIEKNGIDEYDWTDYE